MPTIKEVAEYVAKNAKDVLEAAKKLGLAAKNAKSQIDDDEAQKLADYMMGNIIIEDEQSAVESKKEDKKIQKPKEEKDSKKIKESKRAKTQETPVDSIKSTKTKRGFSIISTNDADENDIKISNIVENDKKEEEIKIAPLPKIQTQEVKTQETIYANSNATLQDDEEPKAEIQRIKPNIPKGNKLLMQANFNGIRIIKKTNDIKEEKPVVKEKTDATSVLSDLIKTQKPKEDRKEKIKKDKKDIKSYKHNEKKEVVIFDRELRNVDYDYENDEIMLIDLNERLDTPAIEEEEKTKRNVLNDKIKVNKYSPWMKEGSIARSKKKGSKYRNSNMDNKLEQNVKVLNLPEEIRVYEFAQKANLDLGAVLTKLLLLGVKMLKNDFLDKDTLEILASEFGLEVNVVSTESNIEDIEVIDDNDLQTRPPVVTIMGHVDHGKTSLLDYIRNTRVVKSEAGGITQHIGAYMVQKNGKWITFIDTPGHEAFDQMRSRGAKVTDIAIIVIAADDGVKPQTIEALNHAKNAGVQIIIAMNKMDKENVNVDKLKSECAEVGFNPQEWGGEYDFIPISAKTGMGVDNLLETILIQAELLELKASFNAKPKAIVLEGSQQKGKGSVATIIAQRGTLEVGQSIVADMAFGKIRSLQDDLGNKIDKLTPSGVAQITGLSEVPLAGSILYVVENDVIAREMANKRLNYVRQKQFSKTTKVTFDELSDMVAKGELKTLPIILRADTQGSLEAIKNSLEKLSNEEVNVSIISFGIGAITQSDLNLASASSNCVILGFNVRANNETKNLSKELGVKIKTYSIIYDLLDDIKSLIGGLMSPIMSEEIVANLNVRDTFSIAKVGTIAGCMVNDGKVERGLNVRVVRNGVVLKTSKIASLKRFKDDVKEVSKGYECGIMLEGFNDLQINDELEVFKEIQQKRELA